MSKRLDYRLTEEQLGELEQAINSSPYSEVRQRAIAIRLLHLGQRPEQVAAGRDGDEQYHLCVAQTVAQARYHRIARWTSNGTTSESGCKPT